MSSMLKFFFAFFLSGLTLLQAQRQVAITMDDPHTNATPLMSWKARNDTILAVLGRAHIHTALFVCGMRVADSNGHVLVHSWDSAGHSICNHTYSHGYFPSGKISLDEYTRDIMRCDSLISTTRNYRRFFRFPYLKEGDTREKRDSLRLWMLSHDYRNGAVTIDATDWYVDERLRKALESDPTTNLLPYKDYYIAHVLDRARFYDSLAGVMGYKNLKHTILLHHTLLNALFLEDVLHAFQAHGWKLIDAKDAYDDTVFRLEPDVLPAGESLIWSLAKKDGRFGKVLRYPGEDSRYEEEILNKYLGKASHLKTK